MLHHPKEISPVSLTLREPCRSVHRVAAEWNQIPGHQVSVYSCLGSVWVSSAFKRAVILEKVCKYLYYKVLSLSLKSSGPMVSNPSTTKDPPCQLHGWRPRLLHWARDFPRASHGLGLSGLLSGPTVPPHGVFHWRNSSWCFLSDEDINGYKWIQRTIKMSSKISLAERRAWGELPMFTFPLDQIQKVLFLS